MIKQKLRTLYYKHIHSSNNSQATFKYCEKFWNGFPFNLDIVNLGSNTGLYGFRYDIFNINAANWALSPQSFNQDLAILKTYCSYIRPRGTVIVPLCPYSSCLKSYTDTELIKYYTILHPGVIEDFSIEKQNAAYKLKETSFSISKKEIINNVLRTLTGKRKPEIDSLDIDFCPLSEQQLKANAVNFIEAWKKQFNIKDMDAPRPSHINEGRKIRVETLKEIVQFCKDHEFNVVIVIPPMTKVLSNMMSQTFRENYIYSFLREAGVTEEMFFDYMDCEEFQNINLYYNSLFLNKKGGELFTQKVLSDLKII